MHTHPILAAAYAYAWLTFAAALLTLRLGTLHRLAKLAQRDRESREDRNNHNGAIIP